MGSAQSNNSTAKTSSAFSNTVKNDSSVLLSGKAADSAAPSATNGTYVAVVIDGEDETNAIVQAGGALKPRGNIYNAAVTGENKLLPEYFIGRDCLQREQERLANAVAMERCARRAGSPCDGKVTVAVKKNVDGTSTTVVETETLRQAKNQFEGESQRLLHNWNQKRATVNNKQRNGALVNASQTQGRDSVAKQPLTSHSQPKFYDE